MRGRNGQVLVVAPILFLFVLGMAALSVDVGRIAVEKARLQSACDAASLAAGSVLVEQRSAGHSESDARAAAVAEAMAFFRANTEAADFTIQFGHVDDGSFVADEESTPALAAKVSAHRDSGAPGGRLHLIFAPMLGTESCEVQTLAVAQIGCSIRAVLSGLTPFAVPESAIPAVGQDMIFYPGDAEDPTITPGTWGLLNLNGGMLGTPELEDWIENGYSGEIKLDSYLGYTWIDGTTGFRAALNSSVIGRIGDEVTVVIYDDATGTGSNTDFRCVGFLRILITGCLLTGNDPYISGRVVAVKSIHDVMVGLALSSPNIRKVYLAL